jgi:thermostable 8-oxoguanine DNA glycosylase
VLVSKEKNYSKVKYDFLESMDEEERIEHLKEMMNKCNVRFPNQKSNRLSENVDKIEEMGGLKEATKRWNEIDGKESKMRFLKKFQGIGDKYARNIGMDVHHPDFRDSIAVDERIKSISEELGLEFSSYESHEDFYRSVAQEVDMSAWELDRVLYRYREEILSRIRTN